MKRFIVILIFGAIANPGFAQMADEGTSIISLSTGKAIAAGVRDLNDTLSLTQKNGQVISLGYDFMVSDVFSVGFIMANQRIRATVNDTLASGDLYEMESGMVNRLYLGFRARWHYGRNEHVRFYSGVRLGVVNFSTGTVDRFHSRPSVLEEHNNRSRYSLGITPIGMNIFVVENLALHAELNIGAPGVFFFGANYRF